MASTKICVLGAGISGISVANNLIDQGIDVSLIEQNPYPGGRSVFYGCKATDSCVHCGVCLVRDGIAYFKKTAPSVAQFSSKLTRFHRTDDSDFQIEVDTSPNFIDWKSCVECGKCREVCPQEAVKQVPGWSFYIDEQACNECGKCVDVCLANAIKLENKKYNHTIDAASVVISAGFKPFDPTINRKWGYGSNPRVVTGSELENLFGQEKLLPDGMNADEVKKVAFVQCVGSRNVVEGQQHCSRVCCAYALRMANRIHEKLPDTAIDFFYMDIQYFGRNFENFWSEVQKKLNFIQSNPISIMTDDQQRPIVRYESLANQTNEEETYDLVVLSNGICPSEKNAELSDIIKLNIDANGFMEKVQDPGIFVAGTCTKPLTIEGCLEDAFKVSNQVLHHLGEKP